MGKLLETKNLIKNYYNRVEILHILRGINFVIDYGEVI